MRVPDTIRDCVCFLCVRDARGEYRYGGTAFFASCPSENRTDVDYIYIVTARHCVEQAKNYGDLFIRLNKKGGGADFLRVGREWIVPDDEGVDLALIPYAPDWPTYYWQSIPSSMFATQEAINKNSIGIGDDVVMAGLFTEVAGDQSNIPIVRSGIISSMPFEPIRDQRSGLPFRAFLVEVRSIGGLSGSPVFVVLSPTRSPSGEPAGPGTAFLLGLIRGHWDYKPHGGVVGYGDDELQAVNMGIGLVTPAIELQWLLESKELIEHRAKQDRTYWKEHAPLNDAL